MRIAQGVTVSAEEKRELRRLAESRTTSRAVGRRASAILLASEGELNETIAKQLGMGINRVAAWRKRFAVTGIPSLMKDLPRSGRPRVISEEKRLEVVRRVTEERPPGRTHWSHSTLASAVGLSETTIGKILREHGLKPHVMKTFKLSNDKHFEEKLRDIVGLYLSPPENAVVFSADEKTQIQALDRTQPGLPIKKGKAGTMTHDYKRNGTTTLFAALNILTGAVIGTTHDKHTNHEWLAFLKKIDAQVPKGMDLHVICDNYATHKHENVRAWLAKHPRVHLHFTPTSASWLNLVERFFRDLTVNAIRRGVFTSVSDLIEAIDVYLIEHNRKPKPFVWTANADDILAKVARARETLLDVKRRLTQEAA
jgi:transposase